MRVYSNQSENILCLATKFFQIQVILWWLIFKVYHHYYGFLCWMFFFQVQFRAFFNYEYFQVQVTDPLGDEWL